MVRSGIIAAACLALAAVPATAQVQLAPGETLLEVQSTGESFAEPDQASLTAGVTSFASTPTAAVNDNATKMTAVIESLLKSGIARRDIQTQGNMLQPQIDYERGQQQRIIGYQARSMVTVRLRDSKQASRTLTALYEAGANDVNGPSFSLADDRAALAASRVDAIAKAKSEADAYAAGFGMRVARVLRISERGQQMIYNPIVVTGSRSSNGVPPPPPVMAPPVEAGEVSQQVTIWVDFALEPL